MHRQKRERQREKVGLLKHLLNMEEANIRNVHDTKPAKLLEKIEQMLKNTY